MSTALRDFTPPGARPARADVTATAAPPSVARRARRSALLREPLLHFLALGALLYAGVSWYRAQRPDDAEIVIDDARVTQLAALYRAQTGATPDVQTWARLVDDWVREEMLYREARRLQLDDGDELVRRRLVQKLEYLYGDAVAAPDEATLRAWHRAHAGAFARPATVRWSQRFFSPDARGPDGARRDAATALAALRTGGASAAGDPLPIPLPPGAQSREALARTLGEHPIVDSLLAAPVGVWVGPVASGYGWHLVRVEARETLPPPPFEEVRDAVLDGWLREARAAEERRWLAELRGRYDVRDVTSRAAASPAPATPPR